MISVVGVYHAIAGLPLDARFRDRIKTSSISLFNPRVRDRDTAPDAIGLTKFGLTKSCWSTP